MDRNHSQVGLKKAIWKSYNYSGLKTPKCLQFSDIKVTAFTLEEEGGGRRGGGGGGGKDRQKGTWMVKHLISLIWKVYQPLGYESSLVSSIFYIQKIIDVQYDGPYESSSEKNCCWTWLTLGPPEWKSHSFYLKLTSNQVVETSVTQQ